MAFEFTRSVYLGTTSMFPNTNFLHLPRALAFFCVRACRDIVQEISARFRCAGNVGHELWPALQAHINNKQVHVTDNPVNWITVQATQSALAAAEHCLPQGEAPREPAQAAQSHSGNKCPSEPIVRYGFEVQSGRLVALQKLAHVTGLAHLHPVAHLNVHPLHGPWLALRSVVVLTDPHVAYSSNSTAPAAPANPVHSQADSLLPCLLRTALGTPAPSSEESEVKVQDALLRDWGCSATSLAAARACMVREANAMACADESSALAAGAAASTAASDSACSAHQPSAGLATLDASDAWAPWAAMRRAVCAVPAPGGPSTGALRYREDWRAAEYPAALLRYHYCGDTSALLDACTQSETGVKTSDT